MRKSRTLIFALLIGLPAALPAQDQRRLEFIIDGAAQDTIFLANYYGNKLFYADTTVADAQGRAIFDRSEGYKPGVYAVVVPGPKYFEIIVNEPVVRMRTRVDDLTGALQVQESRENALFLDYIRFLNDRKAAADEVRSKRDEGTDPVAKARYDERLKELDQEVRNYQRELVEDAAGTQVATIVHLSIPVELPEPRKPDGTLDSTAAYHQFRTHFWDHADLTDPKLVRTPVFQNKMEEYFGRIVPQIPDTLTRLIDHFIGQLGGDEELFRFVVNNLTHRYETSEIMGMDGVFAHMALTYYCPAPGQASRATWMSDDKLAKLCEKARKLEPLTLGKPAPDLILPDSTEQEWVSMHDLPNDYVVIVFWDPNCGVCKKELPGLHERYTASLRDMGVEVYAVAKAVDEKQFKDWKKFIREKGLDWVNVGLTPTVYNEAKQDPRRFIPALTTLESLNYSETYDVYSTPKLFVVDKERKFVAKQLTAEQIVDLIGKLQERSASGSVR